MSGFEDVPSFATAPRTPNFPDEYGHTQETGNTDATAGVGFGAGSRGLIKRAIYNGDFSLGPPDPNSAIEDINAIPGWKLVNDSGGAIRLFWRADTSSGSGGSLYWDIAAGAAGDQAHLEQPVPLRSTRTQNNAFQCVSSWFSATNDANPLVYMETVALKSDQTTTTGSTLTRSSAFSTTLTNADIAFLPTTLTVLPTDAGYLTVRVGVKRNTGPAASSYSVQTSEVALVEGAPITLFPDIGSPGNDAFQAYTYGLIWSLYRGSATTKFYVDDSAATTVVGTHGHLVGDQSLRVLQIAAGATPPSGYVAIWADQSAATAVRVTSDTGLHNIGVDNLIFPATQVPSADANTLDDYEEGSWTPVATFSTVGNLAVVYSTQTGKYTKIGNRVFFDFQINTSTFTFTTSAGTFQVTGLPFTVGATTHNTVRMAGWTAAGYTVVQCRPSAGGTLMDFTRDGSAVATNVFGTTNFTTGTNIVIAGSGHYTV